MPHDVIELEQELRCVAREKDRVLEQIATFRQHMRADETWLEQHPGEAKGSQETREELATLEAYLGELQSQAVALDDLLLELWEQRESWDTPELLLAS
jgi:hypothetical protein